MPKFIMSLGDTAHQFLQREAKSRGITIQELLKVVIIPEWVKHNSPIKTEKTSIHARPLIHA